MKSQNRILAVIPARGGSKGIPFKNLAPLGGRPLIAWTIAAAKAAHGLDRVVVSTDDENIAAAAREHGADVPFLRPAEFSGDGAPALDVIAHALRELRSQDGAPYDAVAYLQPTSPFRSTAQLTDAVALFGQEHPDTLVSVTAVPHNMVPSSLMHPVAPSVPLMLQSPAGQKLRRQEKEKLFARNGPAILIVSAADVQLRGRLYGERVLGFEMDRLSSLDIDDPIDLEMARHLLPLLQYSSGTTL
ncbi:N-acylneuraminate cytidylyltransferase [Polaromonas sp. YR568]|uniref:acylneuraminate cytidylyltransferase family protein n=1 Tax=Polaromonas sp. YR568 TaxID=1855301 RepID=UPI0008E21314|nr:acylneuraminate cytidylyltransferase family protein [Polaromonas sp. YR568]SFU91728.1 N-acylneuraminate cytidylyltransferase [Polaromonas sp. YR568]